MKRNTIGATVKIYADVVQENEPFKGIQIVPIKIVRGEIEWVSKEDASFFGLYGESKKNGLHYCIADALTLEDANDLFNTLDVFAQFTLRYELKTV